MFIALVNIPHNSSQASIDADTEFPRQSLASIIDGNQDDFLFMFGEAPFELEGVMVKAAYSGPLGIQEVGSSRRTWLQVCVLSPSIYRG